MTNSNLVGCSTGRSAGFAATTNEAPRVGGGALARGELRPNLGTMFSMSVQGLVIRPAEEGDAAAVAEIYAPYVRDTAISFETESPTAAIMAQRIVRTLETHPWLVADSGGEVLGYAYAGKHRERAAYQW